VAAVAARQVQRPPACLYRQRIVFVDEVALRQRVQDEGGLFQLSRPLGQLQRAGRVAQALVGAGGEQPSQIVEHLGLIRPQGQGFFVGLFDFNEVLAPVVQVAERTIQAGVFRGTFDLALNDGGNEMIPQFGAHGPHVELIAESRQQGQCAQIKADRATDAGIVAADPVAVLFALSEEVDPFADAEVVPVGAVGRLAAGQGDLVKGRNQGGGAVEQREDVAVRLALEVAHKKPEHIAEIHQEHTYDHRAEEDGGHHPGVGSRTIHEPPGGFGEKHRVHGDVEGDIGKDEVARKEQQVEQQVLSLDVTDLVADHGVDLLRREQAEQGGGDQDVAEAPDQAHHAGGDHFSAEQRPI
jgi:hypothetical protein